MLSRLTTICVLGQESMNVLSRIVLIILVCSCYLRVAPVVQAETPDATFRVVGYYAGRTIPVDSFETEKLTHLIWCFGQLEGNRFSIRTAVDSSIIKSMVRLKEKHPSLKVMLSLGGWGGCEMCSDVFSSENAREEFAKSVREVSDYFQTDGIDLDWEYPVVRGFPGHRYSIEDRDHFTELLRSLRVINRPGFEISFAAGGFTAYLDSSIAWYEVLPYVDFINIMSYDLVHGYSIISGHHTPLYSTPQQTESTDHAVQELLKKGVPSEKLVIGAAFYARVFKINVPITEGLYQSCKFDHTFSYKNLHDTLTLGKYELRFDTVANAPYAIQRERGVLATFDDENSVALKTRYARENHLGGIMFWQLYDDKFYGGLLDIINRSK